jgi:MFS family permease
LGSIAANIGIAIGPIIGGLVLVGANAGSLFMTYAFAIYVMIAVIYRWHRGGATPKSELSPEHVMDAIRLGLHYVFNSPQTQSMFVSASAFAYFGSIILALLPVLVIQEINLGSLGYGLLLGCFGLGSIIGGTLLHPMLRRISSFEQIVITGSTILLAVVMITLAFIHNFVMLTISMLAAGSGWILVVFESNITQ